MTMIFIGRRSLRPVPQRCRSRCVRIEGQLESSEANLPGRTNELLGCLLLRPETYDFVAAS